MKQNEDIAISTLLKQARKKQGLSIKAIAQDICIQSGFLKAIEAGAYDRLPAQTFAVGFVRAYANALGQDADAVVAAFKNECGMAEPAVQTNSVPSGKKARRKYPAWLSPIAGLVGASMCWLALGGGLSGVAFVASNGADVADDQAQLAAVQSSLINTGGTVTVDDTVQIALVAPTETIEKEIYSSRSLFIPAAYAESNSPAPRGQDEILLQAVEDSWVRIARPNGTEIWSGILREGQDYRPNEDGVMLLTTSNAGGLMLTQGQQQSERLGDRGTIIADYALGTSEQATE